MTEQGHSSASIGNLAGQVAIVTGGGRGLGRGYAQALAEAGAAVAVVARSPDQLAEVVAQIQENGGQAMAITADVSNRAAVTQMVASIEAQFGPIDLLVNNAAIASPVGPLWETDPDEWWRTVEINLRSVHLCNYAVLGGMVMRRHGRIINLVSGTTPIPYMSAYNISKMSLIRLTELLATEAQAFGIQVFALGPGLVRTGMTEYLVNSEDGQKWLPWGRQLFEEGHDVPVRSSVQLLLRLATGAADVLSGRYINADEDVEQLVRHMGIIEQDELYTLRLRQFSNT